jgi:IS30 family transposase
MSQAQQSQDRKPWRDEEKLRELYHEKEYSQYEIAEELGCGQNTVKKAMQRHGIETRGRSEAIKKAKQKKYPKVETRTDGYERIRDEYEGEQSQVRLHRLLYVAHHGLESVEGMEIHHKNHIPWDNRIENLEALTPSEHSRLHAQKE